jgi:hypothetical protein
MNGWGKRVGSPKKNLAGWLMASGEDREIWIAL